MQVDLCNGHKNGSWLVSGFFEFTMFDLVNSKNVQFVNFATCSDGEDIDLISVA